MPEPPTLLGGTAIKPVERHGWEAVKYFFYDKEKKEIMGRSGKSWALIAIFYVIYYACLAAFWALMMFIFFLTIDDHQPKWIGDKGLIGTSPGVGLRPTQPDDTIDSSMIIFNKDRERPDGKVPGWGTWTSSIAQFLSYYDFSGRNCTKENARDAGDGCNFDPRQLRHCADPDYGYSRGQPCIYLKLNRLFGVENEAIDESKGFPEDMPDDLRVHIRAQKDRNKVWVNCIGENPADIDTMGPIEYYPKERGFPAMYFPYKNQRNYQSPVVAVQFKKPPIGQLLHIECRAWANNIGYNRMDRVGMVHFELLMLDSTTTEAYNESFE